MALVCDQQPPYLPPRDQPHRVEVRKNHLTTTPELFLDILVGELPYESSGDHFPQKKLPKTNNPHYSDLGGSEFVIDHSLGLWMMVCIEMVAFFAFATLTATSSPISENQAPCSSLSTLFFVSYQGLGMLGAGVDTRMIVVPERIVLVISPNSNSKSSSHIRPDVHASSNSSPRFAVAYPKLHEQLLPPRSPAEAHEAYDMGIGRDTGTSARHSSSLSEFTEHLDLINQLLELATTLASQ
ncbi:hypothetical protein K435DRAFT_794206 [Dendrothele bispora CBS 962.96]|uniref:Uncharacterized protein n=1 Tax=Dendrothele bispora (strain CBS 962.96) TaxID=1314807 RepID=A0A4S8MCS4_DENBC|nr:hypothetical protein K435DRAFT_794206 [Dendrothele bispora CBS 962.96]